jgi:hypothetical protein
MRWPVLKWCGAALLGSFIVQCSKRRTLSMLEMEGGFSNQYREGLAAEEGVLVTCVCVHHVWRRGFQNTM